MHVLAAARLRVAAWGELPFPARNEREVGIVNVGDGFDSAVAMDVDGGHECTN